ncbi:MAG: NAD(P)H-dependent flavin oxidoreductase [Actinomycetes bacterium]
MLRTRLTEILDVEHPVMLAGMGGVSYHRLVAAVSEAGGYGCFGASTLPAEELRAEMRAARALTDKPFGVDLLTALPQRLLEDVALLIDEGATVFAAGLGIPHDVIEMCHERNVLVLSMCGKVRHAIAAVEAGCDIVVAQGTEAGGHTGQIATLPLVAQVVAAVGDRVPVVAAGGISDGRGLAAALALGADGVWVGTRFIATPEANTGRGFKDALLRSREDDTVISKGFSGKPMRVVRNEVATHFETHPEELKPFPDQLLAAIEGGWLHLGANEDTPGVDPDRECFPAGQAVGGIRALVPAGDLVVRMVEEAETALRGAAATIV